MKPPDSIGRRDHQLCCELGKLGPSRLGIGDMLATTPVTLDTQDSETIARPRLGSLPRPFRVPCRHFVRT